ncbi:hypothetical protein [Nocardia brasiliensis]|uniref:hypothetical protein n=1 Tax=Nocardia brasiliensis TaxID=37326 RepID=UPI0033F4068E
MPEPNDRPDSHPASSDQSGPAAEVSSPATPMASSTQDPSDPDVLTDTDVSSEDEPPQHDSDRSSGKRTVYFNQYFNGTVHASHSPFGVSASPEFIAPLTGKLSSSEIDELSSRYVRPKVFPTAFEILQRVHAIVLEGASSTGKRAGATMLLRELATDPMISLPPTMSLNQLATFEYEAGRGYLVTDSEHTARRAGTEHEWHAIRDQVCEADAWLVITGPATSGGDSEFVPRVQWERPDTYDLLITWLGASTLTDVELHAALTDIQSQIPSEYALTELQLVVALVIEGAATSVAIQVFEEGARKRVVEWFDALNEDSRRDLLAVTVSAFLDRCGQRTFETGLTELEFRFTAAAAAAAAVADNKPEPSTQRTDTIPELRSAMVDGESLLCLTSEDQGIRTRALVTFREDLYRVHVLAELWRRMDVTFWNTVRDWLCETLSHSDDDDAAHRERTVARALIILAGISFDEVAEAYLEPWSQGEHGLACRDMAIFVLWDMCAGKKLAPAALHIAARWAKSGTTLQKWTAAYAFSGVLGVSYPEDATRQLWRLIISGESSDVVEWCAVMAEFFARLATRSPQADVVLDFLERKHRDRRSSARSRLLLEIAIILILGAKDDTTGLSAIFGHLDHTPNQHNIVARLWAIPLRGSRFRWQALNALLDGLRDLAKISDEPEAVVHSLTAAFTQILPTRECRAFGRSLATRHSQRVATTYKRRTVRRITVSKRTAQREARTEGLIRIMLTSLRSEQSGR